MGIFLDSKALAQDRAPLHLHRPREMVKIPKLGVSLPPKRSVHNRNRNKILRFLVSAYAALVLASESASKPSMKSWCFAILGSIRNAQLGYFDHSVRSTFHFKPLAYFSMHKQLKKL